jgi:hypothetical protein
MALPRAALVQTSSEPLRYGASGSASSSFTMDARRTWLRRSGRTKAKGDEVNKVIDQFNELTTQDQQQIIDFLRAL